MFAFLPKRNRNRRKTAEPRMRLPQLNWRRLGTTATAVAGIVAVLALFAGLLDRPVQHVEVKGKFLRVAPVEIEQAVAPFAATGFLSIDLKSVRQSLEKIAWVDRAQVERSWPNGLRVFITEQVPAAKWGVDGLLNTRGELFLRDARHMPPELPQLDGPEGSEAEVAKLYLDTYPRLLAVGMRLAKVELDPRGAWVLGLGNGVVVRLGRQDVAARLERFITVASPLVATRASDITYVDLRYSNGFSVGWNAGVVPDAATGNASGPARTVRRLEEVKPDV
jgi:cell division protein FtsQ